MLHVSENLSVYYCPTNSNINGRIALYDKTF